jgi:hypothetical protein
VDDPIANLLKKLLDTEDMAEFEQVSGELKAALHERIEQLRKAARSLQEREKGMERRKAPRTDRKKH